MVTFITPQVQGFIDPDTSNPIETFGIRTDLNQIIGLTDTAGVIGYSRFYFPDGSLLNDQVGADISLNLPTAPASCTFTTPYGNRVISAKDGIANFVGMAVVNPYTTPWTVTQAWGNSSSGSDYPNNVPIWVSLVPVTINGKTYIWGGGLFGGVFVLPLLDGFIPTGFSFYHDTINVGHALDGTAGPQTAGEGVVYWLSQDSGAVAFPFGKTTIPNSGEITSETIKTFVPTDFQVSGTGMAMTSFAYDQTDGNLIAHVTVGDGVTQTGYIVKVSSVDGSVIWQVTLGGIGGASSPEGFSQSVIKNGLFYWYVNSTHTFYVIDTSDGTATTHTATFTGGTSLSCDFIVSNDGINGIITYATWGSAGTGLTVLNSTPASGTSLAAVYFVEGSSGSGNPDHVIFCKPTVSTE